MAVYNMECGECKEPATESELIRIDCKDMLMCEYCINNYIYTLIGVISSSGLDISKEDLV
jgi:hypothetical protein